MSVNSEHIILYGWDVGYDAIEDWSYEKREQYYYDENGVGDVVLVADGMGGEYALVGVLQFCSDDIPVQTVEKPSVNKQQDLFHELYREMELGPVDDPEHYVLTHYS